MALTRDRYAGVNQVHLAELLAEREGVLLSRSTVTETSADYCATRQQIIEFLQASDWSEAEASVGSAERVGLIQRVPGQDAWSPTAAGWALWAHTSRTCPETDTAARTLYRKAQRFDALEELTCL